MIHSLVARLKDDDILRAVSTALFGSPDLLNPTIYKVQTITTAEDAPNDIAVGVTIVQKTA